MEENTQRKSGFVALVGQPNVGKSTLMNHPIGQKITITSDKPQTARNRIQTVCAGKQRQITFLDIPGIHKARNKLGEYMANVAEHTLKGVDVVLWLVEPTTFIGAGERHMAEQLNKTRTPVILVIDRINTVERRDEILTFMTAYKDVCRLAEAVPPSALKDKNTGLLTELTFKYPPYGPQFYDKDTVTDQPMCQITSELIREKALRLLSDEISHGIAVTIEKVKERPNGIIDTDASIVRERDSHRGVVIGKGGNILKRTGAETRKDIGRMMDAQINLQLWVKVRKEWRSSDLYMKNYGYDGRDV